MPKLYEILAIVHLEAQRVVFIDPNAREGTTARLMECSYDENTEIARMLKFVGYVVVNTEFERNEIRVLYRLEV